MSSPRGFVAGGMVCMGRVADADLGRIPDEGEDERKVLAEKAPAPQPRHVGVRPMQPLRQPHHSISPRSAKTGYPSIR